jgi:hypothetical protein
MAWGGAVMSSDTMERRRVLALDLLTQLKSIRDHLNEIMSDLNDSSGDFLKRVYVDNNDKIEEKVSQFNENVERVKSLNLDMTSTFNDWYLFIKDEKELSSPLFPLRLRHKRKQMKSKAKDIKQEITGIGIKNRLIREDIMRLESNLEYEATVRLKKDVRYEDYLSHIKIKSQLLEEIKYLLPTISGIDISEIRMDRLEDVIAALGGSAA